MALDFRKWVKGILIQNESDKSKEVRLTVDNSASSGTNTTIVAKQTLSRSLDLPNTSGTLVEQDFAQTLTNKTIDGDNNTVQDLALTSLKTVIGDADKFVSRDVSGQVVSTKAVPVGTVVGNSDTQTLTNKTIDADSNTISNIDNADIKVSAAIDAAKIHDGSVSNTEFGYLDGVTSSIQTQLTAKAQISGATDNRLVRTDGATGIQQSGIAVDDVDNISGVNNLTVNGDLTVSGTTTTINTATLDVEDKNITVNFNGTDVTGEGAGLTIDRTGTSGSLVYEDALASKFKAGALGSEIQLANVSSTQSFANKNLKSNTNLLTGAKANTFERETGNQQIVTIPDVSTGDTFVTQAFSQTLTNKDIDGGTASNTSRLTVPKDTLANLLTLTRKEGTILYATDTDKFYRDDGSNLQEIGSGSGEKNFITNGDAEAGTTGWATYADAASSRPVDGAGGSPSVTFTRSTSSPLEGQGSFLFTKDAVNRQGQGVSYDFAIDSAYKAKVLTIEMDYIVNSGTFVAGSSSTDSDVIAYIYDVTNSTLIEPSSIKLLSNSSTISDKFRASFQTSATGTSYRLILHCASTSASAYVLKIDNIKVSPINYVYGTPSADLGSQAWTVTNASATSDLRVTREGRRIYIDGAITFTGAATGQFGLTIPSAYSADTTNVYKDLGSVSQPVGLVRFLDVSPGNVYDTILQLNSSSSLLTVAELANGTYVGPIGTSATVPHTWASGDKVLIQASWIVSGFGASTQMSDQTDTRVVDFSISGAALAVTSGNPIVFNTSIKDSHTSFNTATGRYVIPVSGDYNFGVFGNTTAATINISIYKNAVLNATFASSNSTTVTGNSVLITNLNVGDIVDLRPNGSATFGGTFTGSRVSGPSTIASSEEVSCRYTLSSGPSISNSGSDILVTFLTKNYDTHGSYSTGTGKFTAPIAGRYRVSTTTWYASATYAAGNGLWMSIYKNASLYSSGNVTFAATAGTFTLANATTDCIDLLAGETIEVRTRNARSAGSTNLSTSASENYLSIEKIK
jgi:hypothetical protein